MAISDLLAPTALEFKPRSLVFGDQVARVLAVVDYPNRVGPGWLAKLAAQPGVSVSYHLRPSDNLNLTQALNQSINEYQSRLTTGGNALFQSRWKQSLADAEELLRKIDQENQTVFRFIVVILVTAEDEEELARRARRVEAVAAAAKMRVRVAAFKQEAGLRAAAPWAVWPKEIEALSDREIPSETLAAGFPFVSSGLNHGSGLAWGRDEDGGLVLINRWEIPLGSGQTNANVNILGTSGSGKTFAATLLFLREFALGRRVFIVDPEREYRRICRKVEGNWVNTIGGGRRINPLQVPVAPLDVDEDDEDQGATPSTYLSLHIQRLKTFFRLYMPSLDDLERAGLEDVLLAAYKEKGVGMETEPSGVTEWPILSDIYRLLSDRPDLERVAALLRSAVEGADSFLWNGPTTLPEDSEFTVLDIRDLTDADENVRRAQYFLTLTYAWDLVRRGKAGGEWTILGVDEAWIMADPDTPEAMKFLKSVAKRIRKYNGALVVITQNSVDFLAPEIARMAEPIITNSSLTLLMRQNSKDLKTLRDLLALSDAEADRLAGANRGQGLLLAGNNHVWLRVEASPYELEAMAK